MAMARTLARTGVHVPDSMATASASVHNYTPFEIRQLSLSSWISPKCPSLPGSLLGCCHRHRHQFVAQPGCLAAMESKGPMPMFSRREKRKSATRIVANVTVLGEPDTNPPSPATVTEAKEMKTIQITKDTLILSGRCKERLKYEIEYGLKQGTTDNAYVIRSDGAVALINVPDEAFSESFVAALSGIVPLREITYVILGHLSPKRMKSILCLLNARPDDSPLQVFCSNPAAKLLSASLPEGAIGRQLSINVVKSDSTLDLGGGHELQFLLTPTPRWPDGMCVYDPFNQLLFTHKLFSAHTCTDSGFDVGGWDRYGADWRFFYDCMLGPTPKQTAAALGKLPVMAQFVRPSYDGKRGLELAKADLSFIWSSVMRLLNLPIDKAAALARLGVDGSGDDGALIVSMICPLHGPMVRSSITELLREYRKWTEENIKRSKGAMVAVIYASAYGNTAALAQAISRGISKSGVGIETLNCEMVGSEEVVSVVRDSCGFVIGSPTLAGHMPTPVQESLGAILRDPDARSKPCGVFGSFGWSGEAIDEIENRLKDGGFSFAFPAIRCKFKPTEAMLQLCEESGTDLAQAVVKVNKKKEAGGAKATFTTAPNVEQAVGRVVGSLCVLAARSGDAECAMLASWVSQASFVPPGITIAVAKDRAVEGLVLPGGEFVLNILGEGKHSSISKQLLKKFKPGEPRFGDLSVSTASNGCVVLNDAIAFLQCSVVDRMETGDHWILYATVQEGKLNDESTLTAVHHRKTGSYY